MLRKSHQYLVGFPILIMDEEKKNGVRAMLLRHPRAAGLAFVLYLDLRVVYLYL